MKYSIVLFAAMAGLAFTTTSCNESTADETTSSDSTSVESTTAGADMNAGSSNTTTAEASYYDLSSGRAVTRDEASGRYVDESGTPVEFYVDRSANDTFYGETGSNVNNSMIHEGETWRLNDDAKVRINDEKMKIKTDDQKIKIKDHDKDGSAKMKVKEK